MQLVTAITYLEQVVNDVGITPTMKKALETVIADYKNTHKPVYTKCQYCGKEFETVRQGKKYCSQACGYNAWYVNLKKDPVKYRKRLNSQNDNARKRREEIINAKQR